MRKARVIIVAIVAVLALVALVGCQKTAGTTGAATSKAAANFIAGEVTDTGGIDDRSFNASAWKGLQDAQSQLGIQIQYLGSTQQSDYAPNIQQFVTKKANLIVTVGFLMGDATAEAAKANPNQKFAIVDYSYEPALTNVLALTYQTDQAAFMAGYVAAGMSKTGKIGTFGGMNIPTVTIFMNGYAAGARYYNQQKKANVKVLGWDPEKAQGTFTDDFTNQAKGKTVTETLMNQGADVILPVAGSVGLGAAAAVQQHDTATPAKFVYLIGVDTDWYVSANQYASILLTTVVKGIDASVLAATKQALDGTFKGGNYVGTLANGGVSMAPYHDMDSKVSAELKAEIDTIKAGIIAGTISVDPKSYPAK